MVKTKVPRKESEKNVNGAICQKGKCTFFSKTRNSYLSHK